MFDPFNISSCRVYFDDNSSYFDFQSGNTSSVNFSSPVNDKLRFELIYDDGSVVTRYVDVSLLDGDLRVCANKEGITHYEQLIISASEKVAVLKNVFSDCVIAADYTRFAYQDSYLLKAYSIASLYYLYTFDDDAQVFLASLDGSIATYINLDTLEFNREAYDIRVVDDAVSFERSGDYEMMIYYRNLADDNEKAELTITDLDDGSVVLSGIELATPNEFTMYFNYLTLNVTNETLFMLEINTTSTSGIKGTVKKYFNAFAESGLLQSGVAFGIAFLLVVFGFSFASARITLSWFGIVMILGSIAILSLAVSAWFVTMLLVIDVIVLIYTVIMMVSGGSQAIS